MNNDDFNFDVYHIQVIGLVPKISTKGIHEGDSKIYQNEKEATVHGVYVYGVDVLSVIFSNHNTKEDDIDYNAKNLSLNTFKDFYYIGTRPYNNIVQAVNFPYVKTDEVFVQDSVHDCITVSYNNIIR